MILRVGIKGSWVDLKVSNTTVMSAPIEARWTEGKSLDMVIGYYRRKNCPMKIIKNGQEFDVK